MRLLVSLLLLITAAHAQLGPGGATASFKGSLPPKPTADLSAEQQSAIESELTSVSKAFEAVKNHERSADAAIFIKAVRYALDFHEWYDKKPEDGVKKATALLAEAKVRIASLAKNETPWVQGGGQKVLGFYSQIDGSPQPYGVEVPEGLEFGAGKNPIPMWVWLHGRGDTSTDLHFVYSRLMAKKPGQFQPAGTIVIHPFGRYCNGWKSAGETDVFEARNDAKARFNVDENRIALAGFSMGGAGAWHLGAHFADQWACVHTGAGFADVKRYTKLAPENFPPWYEQKLWGVYDVPDYARNFHNVPLISYSGEIDSQRDSAEYMMEILAKEGLHPPHLIGPGMPHKYHPETIKEVQKLIEAAVAKGRNPWPKKVVLQTRTLAYNKMFWVSIEAMDEQWLDTRVEAEVSEDNVLRAKTINVAAMRMTPKESLKSMEVDGQSLPANATWLRKDKKGKWQSIDGKQESPWQKSTAKCGTIDDSFRRAFLIVLPEGDGISPKTTTWAEQESLHFIQRWRSLMRGDPRVKRATEVTADDMQRYDLVLWAMAKTIR
jgi:Prolyl oligopeptidase family